MSALGRSVIQRLDCPRYAVSLESRWRAHHNKQIAQLIANRAQRDRHRAHCKQRFAQYMGQSKINAGCKAVITEALQDV